MLMSCWFPLHLCFHSLGIAHKVSLTSFQSLEFTSQQGWGVPDISSALLGGINTKSCLKKRSVTNRIVITLCLCTSLLGDESTETCKETFLWCLGHHISLSLSWQNQSPCPQALCLIVSFYYCSTCSWLDLSLHMSSDNTNNVFSEAEQYHGSL